MTSSNGNIFRITGPLCGEFTGPGEFPTQRPVTPSFDFLFDLRLNKRLSKQPRGWWFETLSWSLWRHRNGECTFCVQGWLWDVSYGYSRWKRSRTGIKCAVYAHIFGFEKKKKITWWVGQFIYIYIHLHIYAHIDFRFQRMCQQPLPKWCLQQPLGLLWLYMWSRLDGYSLWPRYDCSENIAEH